MPTYQKITVRSGWAVPVSANTGATVTIANTAGDSLYYLDSQQVSAALNDGTLTAGQSVTLTPPAWMVSASSTDVSITYADSPVPGFEIPPAVVSGASRTASSTDVATTADNVLLLDATSAPFNETLPSAIALVKRLTLRAISAGTNLVSVLTTSGQLIGRFSVSAPVQSAAVAASVGGLDGIAYYYVVTAVNENGETTVSNERSATGPSALLAAPVQTAGSTSTTGGTGLAATTDYYYVVTALNANGETIASNEVKLTTGAGGTNSNTINWNAVTGATGYNVYRRTTDGLTGQKWAAGNVTTFTDVGTGSTSSSAPPGANTTGSKITVSWAAAAGASYYKVYRGLAPGTETGYVITSGTSLVDIGQPLTTGTPPATNQTILTLGSPASGAPYASVDVVSDGANWGIV